MSKKSRNKIPIEISTEDLLQSLNSEDTDEVIEHTRDVVPFLSHFNLRPGGYAVNCRILYELYKHWSKNPVSNLSFTTESNKYLLSSLINHKSHFLINISTFKLSKKTFQLIKNRNKNKTHSPRYRKHFENFIQKYNLDKEDIWIQSFILFYIYDKWCYSIKKKRSLGYENFIKFCDIYFQKARKDINRHKWYLVSNDIKNHITQQEVEEIINARKKEKKK